MFTFCNLFLGTTEVVLAEYYVVAIEFMAIMPTAIAAGPF